MTRSLRIVVAEDERANREYLQELLSRAGHQVVTAADGRQLTELCRVAPPDLVVTDIKMPDMDGIEAAMAVNRDREIPVILVSGYPRGAEIAAEEGVPFFPKPVDLQALRNAVEHALEGNSAQSIR